MGFFDSIGRAASKGFDAVGGFFGDVLSGASEAFSDVGPSFHKTGGIGSTLGGILGDVGELGVNILTGPTRRTTPAQTFPIPSGTVPGQLPQKTLEDLLGPAAPRGGGLGGGQSFGSLAALVAGGLVQDPRELAAMEAAQRAKMPVQQPLVAGLPVPGGRLRSELELERIGEGGVMPGPVQALGGLLGDILTSAAGTALSERLPGAAALPGGAPVAGAMVPGAQALPFGGRLFRATATGIRVRSLVPIVHPSTGDIVYFRHVGKPKVFAGDERIMKKTAKALNRKVVGRGR